MLDYIQSITEFLKDNFNPSNPASANVKLNTDQLLNFIFRTFPVDCISDYELNDILLSLNYKRFTYVVESYKEIGKKKDRRIEVSKSLEVGWCMTTPFDLRTEEMEKD
ncbi:hypothetical protein [Flavobacterium panacagri]|uniref:hypothetical protein n=1 Tax=Flavobacterium panacagri TaxID=3034146 RepID=UPI0025A68889|nr:hypothetical protein [Flavobacterium panacagri]